MAPHLLSHEQEIQNTPLHQENPGKYFRDRKGILVDFMPNGITINAAAYCETIKGLEVQFRKEEEGCQHAASAYCMTMQGRTIREQRSSCCRISTGKF